MKCRIQITFLAFLLGLAFLAGCTMKPLGPPPENIIIAFSADTRAELYECGG